MLLRTRTNGNALRLAKRNVGERCYGANAPENRAPGYSLGQREVPPYNRRVKITMSVTLAPELTEAIKESAERQGLSLDDWIRYIVTSTYALSGRNKNEAARRLKLDWRTVSQWIDYALLERETKRRAR